MRGALALALAALAGCGGGASSAPRSPADEAADTEPDEAFFASAVQGEGEDDAPIVLRRSIVADEYFWLRTKVLEGEAPPAFAEAFAAMHELRSDLSNDPTAWEDLEVPLGAAKSAGDLVTAYGALPVSKDVGGRPVELQRDALRLARAIASSSTAFRRGPYRAHAIAIAAAAKELGARLVPRRRAIFGAVSAEMALAGMTRPVVLTLVGEAPYPGIFAADARGRVMASFVRVKGLEGGALVETVVGESLHAFDEMTVREPTTAMNVLRAALAERGMDESSPDVEMAVNTVTFAEAASLVRRFVDPAHRPLGERGFYTLYPPAPAIVEAWTRHAEGEAREPLAATIDTIAKAVAPP